MPGFVKYTPTSFGTNPVEDFMTGHRAGSEVYDRDTLFEMGKRAIAKDWQGAQNTAFERGNPALGFQVQSFRDGREDRARMASDRARESEKKMALEAAGLFQNFIDKEADPARRMAMTETFLSSHPALVSSLGRYGVDVKSPDAVSRFFQSQARGYQAPEGAAEARVMEVGGRLVRINPNGTAEEIYSAGPDAGTDEVSQREAAAARLGLDPGSDAYRSYALTGRLPRESEQSLTATDKKAILEADEMVMSTQSAVSELDRAIRLSATAYDGATANERAWLMSLFGASAANDTRELNQAVTQTALQQLKSIFGGNPTEGERKILLDIQGSAEQLAPVRERILSNAKQLAQKRLQFYQDRANEMRGGTYYGQPGRGQAPPAAGPPQTGAKPDYSTLSDDEIMRRLGAP